MKLYVIFCIDLVKISHQHQVTIRRLTHRRRVHQIRGHRSVGQDKYYISVMNYIVLESNDRCEESKKKTNIDGRKKELRKNCLNVKVIDKPPLASQLLSMYPWISVPCHLRCLSTFDPTGHVISQNGGPWS